MSDYFEIAYAVASKRICLFTGTGFSKSITDNQMPSWQQLLESLCDLLKDGEKLKSQLFPKESNNPLTLEESAQVIAISLKKNKKNINNEISKIIKSIKLKGDYEPILEFFKEKHAKVITTNYDKLVEKLSEKNDCNSLAMGLPIPHRNANIEVYHVHGSIDVPRHMVVTSSDYFRYNLLSYFSSKLNTILHENTVVILGYSLSDTNLKTIINNYNSFSEKQGVALNIFFVARAVIAQPIKDFYGHSYGIRVIDNTDVDEFFSELNTLIPEAESVIEKTQKNIKKVLYENKFYTDKHLKIENSFYEIISSIRAIGVHKNNPKVVRLLGKIINKKIDLTGENGAWGQYVQLANWLIYLACFFQLKGTSIEKIYLKAVYISMTTMSEKKSLGYSWHAYKAWRRGWLRITPTNRAMIRKQIKKKTKYIDALKIVKIK